MTRTSSKLFLAQNGILIALALMIVFFAVNNPRFLSPNNLMNIVLQSSELALIAIPVALLIMSGQIDFSVGAVASASAVVAGLTMVATGSPWVGAAAGVGIGLIAGAVNGILSTYLKLNSLIVTMAGLSIWSGFSLLITNGATVTGLPASFRAFGTFSIAGVRIQVMLLVLLLIAAWWLTTRGGFGRQIYAVGGNARAAHLMGISVHRVRLILFLFSGGMAAFAGIMLSAKLQSSAPNIGSGLEIQALTVVLLGGVAMSGGSGRILGVLYGLLFVGVMKNGLVIVGVSQFLQTIITGVVLLIAIAVDGSIQRVLRASWTKTPKSGRETRADGSRTDATPDTPTPSGLADARA